jgi:hypothetical protein
VSVKESGYQRLGFLSNPFLHDLAQDEPALPSYYVKPPYFEHVLGEARNQTSRLVFGDFGRGKTALRRCIEVDARRSSSRVLCISYDSFPYLSRDKPPSAVTLRDHIDEVMRSATVALLMLSHHSGASRLTAVQREIARWCVTRYYKSLTSAEVESHSRAVSTLPEHYWRRSKEHGSTLANWLNKALAPLTKATSAASSPEVRETYEAFEDDPLFLLQKMYDLLEPFDVASIVVLVDNVDQCGPEMQEPDNILRFLKPMLFHYNLLSLQDLRRTRQVFGFKFFLPYGQTLKAELRKAKFRFDRVITNTVEWCDEEMRLILHKRLEHYSNRKVGALARIADDPDVDDKIVRMARGTPRHMLIVGQMMLEEYDRLGCHGRIPSRCIEQALQRFQEEIRGEDVD